MTPIPTALNTDAQWAQFIQCLQERGLIVHAREKEIFFSRKK